MTDRRLIETAFPLKQVSLDSVHEKNVRHGHISTLHIWPARRPLAASRATLLATLLRDPENQEERDRLLARMAGTVEPAPAGRVTGGGERDRKETRGGILHWGRESEPEGVDELDRFRAQIRKAFGGRTPRVLDPFAGGGAIPLEAMRLGCEAVAADLNPVAWFILRCTLHYPRLLAGRKRPLPACAVGDRQFAESFLKARGIRRTGALREALARLGHGDGEPVQPTTLADAESPASSADAAWHLRAWGRHVLAAARRELAARYPTYAEFEPLRRKGRRQVGTAGNVRFRRRPPRLLEPDADGRVSTTPLNAEFDSLYLEDESRPRWIAKPAVAYLWARTVRCGGCRAEIPLLKTRWLCKKAKKRVRLTLEPRPSGSGVDFGIEQDVPEGSGNAAQKREHDRTLGAGTMSANGARCPACGAIATTKDIRAEGLAGRLGERMTAVVVEGQAGKEYRLPTAAELDAARVERAEIETLYAEIPFGQPDESIVAERPSPNSRGASGLPRYGFQTWRTLFANRQLLVLGMLVREIRRTIEPMRGAPSADHDAPAATFAGGCPDEWREALAAYLSCAASKFADYSSAICSWHNSGEKLRNTFARFALPMVWDYCEVNPLADTTGGFLTSVEWVARVLEHLDTATPGAPAPTIVRQSATAPGRGTLRPRVHRSALLRCHSLFRPDGLLPRLAAPHAARAVAGNRCRVRRAARAEVGRRRERRRTRRSTGSLRYGQGAVQAGVRGRHAAHVPPLPRRASGRRAAGRRVRQQASRGMGDPGVRADPRGFRRGRILAHSDRDAEQGRGRRAPVVLHLAGLPEAPRNGSPRLGQPGTGRHAGERHRTPAGLLGRGHSRAGLRVGGDRAGAGGVQPASGGQDGRRPGPAVDRRGVPAPRAADGGRVRGQQAPRSAGRRHRRSRRSDHLLPAAPQGLRPRPGPRRRLHPVRPVVQRVGRRSGRAPGSARQRRTIDLHGRGWPRERRCIGQRRAPQDVEPTPRPRPGRAVTRRQLAAP